LLNMAALPGVPGIYSLSDCASFATTFRPYLPQLSVLPAAFYKAAMTSSQALLNFYSDTNPVLLGFGFSIFAGAVFLVVAEANKNYSQVDRMWPILPFSYVLHYNLWARRNGIPSARLDLAVLVIGLWASRLTYNYWRKGGYSVGSEDYRWQIVAKRVGALGMFVMNVTFISFIQSILLFLIASPAYILLLVSRVNTELTLPDIIFGSLIVTLLAIETVADHQQWEFHQAKHAYEKTAKLPANSKYSQIDLDRGFCVSGLWSWSRHPNFACEQSIWLVFYQWAAFASKAPLNWTGVGVIGLLGVFFGSTRLTEAISAKKYPQYKEYQELVARFVPGFLGTTWGSRAHQKTN